MCYGFKALCICTNLSHHVNLELRMCTVSISRNILIFYYKRTIDGDQKNSKVEPKKIASPSDR